MENDEGRIVQETFEPDVPPGESVGAGSAGHDPGTSPLTLTFDVGSASAAYVWDVEACARVDSRSPSRPRGRSPSRKRPV